ncbi:MAG: DUF2092 domain-containing protein [Ideonella sp.]|nr:DUF2092 domain-containing protein [Ideonella sp.]
MSSSCAERIKDGHARYWTSGAGGGRLRALIRGRRSCDADPAVRCFRLSPELSNAEIPTNAIESLAAPRRRTSARPALRRQPDQPGADGGAPPAQPAAKLVDPAAVQALKDMGAHLQTLKRFQARTELTGERVLADGQKLQHGSSATLDVARPNRVRAVIVSPRSERRIIYDGKTVTLYTPTQQFYSTVAFSGSLGELVEQLQARYDVEMPLSDLFVWGTPAAPLDKIESAMIAGQDVIGDDLCDHYAFRQGKVDWQIWITVGSKPLPRKVVITSRADEARPQSVSLLEWNLKPAFTDAVFKFTPRPGAKAIEILPRKTP